MSVASDGIWFPIATNHYSPKFNQSTDDQRPITIRPINSSDNSQPTTPLPVHDPSAHPEYWSPLGTRTKAIMLDGYTELVTDRGRAGWSCHLVTILFSQLPGPRSAVIARMRDEVQRVYSTLLTRVHRKPRKATADELPVLVAAWIYPSTSGTGVGSDGPLQRRASCPRFDDDAADVPTEGVARRPHPETSKSLCRSRKVRPAGPRPSVVEDHQRVVDYVLKTVRMAGSPTTRPSYCFLDRAASLEPG